MAEGATGGQQIARLEKGDTTRTAAHADVMNQIIDRLNALSNATFARSGTGEGKQINSDSNTVYDLGNVGAIPDPQDDATYVWSVTNFVQSWLATEQCRCDNAEIDGGGP